jgi:hypothetical protein
VKKITEAIELFAVDEKRFLGDSLPAGLKLLE